MRNLRKAEREGGKRRKNRHTAKPCKHARPAKGNQAAHRHPPSIIGAGNLSMFFAAVSHDADDFAKRAVCGNFALNKLG
jgi:hypothetical protein